MAHGIASDEYRAVLGDLVYDIFVCSVRCGICGKPHMVTHGKQTDTWAFDPSVISSNSPVVLTKLLHPNVANRPLDPSQPVHFYWMWHPLGESFSRWMLAKVMADSSLQNASSAGIIVIPKSLMSPDLCAIFDSWTSAKISMVWIVDDSVFSGADLFAPSIKAESAMVCTIQNMNVQGFSHYWPSFMFHESTYSPATQDDKLATMYSEHQRKKVEMRS